MADIAEIVFMKPAAFTIGANVHKGIKRLSYTKRAAETYNYIPEGSLTVTRQEPIETEQAPVQGQIISSSSAALALAGTTAASATIDGVDVTDGTGVVVTLTNATFKEVGGGGQRRSPDDVTIAYEATAIAIAPAA